MRVLAVVLLVGLLLASPPAGLGQEVVLENPHVRVTVDPRRGGAVTSLDSKRAVTLPLIAHAISVESAP